MLAADRASDYRELYYRWEREQWSAGDIDLTIDRDQWNTAPEEVRRVIGWGVGVGLVAKEQGMKALVPLVDAAPTEEQQVFLATQLADDARHAVFYDMYLEQVIMRGGQIDDRLAAQRDGLDGNCRNLLFDVLPAVAGRVKTSSSDGDAFAVGVLLHHVLLEGTIARTISRLLMSQVQREGLLPGLAQGLDAISTDVDRHVAFGTTFLAGFVADSPSVEGTIRDELQNLAPPALAVLEQPENVALAREALSEQLAAIGIRD